MTANCVDGELVDIASEINFDISGFDVARGVEVCLQSDASWTKTQPGRGRNPGMALAVSPCGGPAAPPNPPPVESGSVLAPCQENRALPLRPPRTSVSPVVPDISVVIVNYCQWRNTTRLVRQLRRSLAFRTGAAEIVVIDNQSRHHRLSRTLRQFRGVTLKRFRENRGFAQAVNQGCSLSRSRWALLLNPDVTVTDGFLDEVIATLEQTEVNSPRVGVIGFRLRNPDGSAQASSGPHPTLPNTLTGLFLPRSRRKCRHLNGSESRQVPWVTGGCLLVRRDCFEQLGGLDESFFLYYEDADFCRRAAEHGWDIVYDPVLEVTHHWPLHARRVPPSLRLITRHALLTYARKHWPRWQSHVLRRLVHIEAWVRRGLAEIRGQKDAMRCYDELHRLVSDLYAGRDAAARQRVAYAARFLAPIAAEQDGRTY